MNEPTFVVSVSIQQGDWAQWKRVWAGDNIIVAVWKMWCLIWAKYKYVKLEWRCKDEE